jgi:hypothetical protein
MVSTRRQHAPTLVPTLIKLAIFMVAALVVKELFIR